MTGTTKSVYDRAVQDAKQMTKLAERNALRVVAEALAPQIKKAIKEGLAEGDEGDDAPVPEADETAPETDEGAAGDEGDGGNTTIDLDQLSTDIEKEMKDADLGMGEDEDEDLEGMDEAKGEDEVPPPPVEDEEDEEITDSELKEAYNEMIKEFDTPPKGDPDEEDPNADGKPTGLLAKGGKSQNKTFDDVEPPAKEDWMKKESHYKLLLAKSVKKLAEKNGMIRKLGKQINEMKLDQMKLAYITDLTSRYPEVSRDVKKAVIERFDDCRTVKEAKILFRTAKEILGRSNKRSSSLSESHRRSALNRSSSGAAGMGTRPTSGETLKEHSVANRYRHLAGIKTDSKK